MIDSQNKNQLIFFSRSKKGDLIFNFQPQFLLNSLGWLLISPFKLVGWVIWNFILSVNSMSQNYLAILLVTALGLGFGFGIIIFHSPARVGAGNPISDQVKISELLPSLIQISSPIKGDSFPVVLKNQSDLKTFFLLPREEVITVKGGYSGYQDIKLVAVGSRSQLGESLNSVRIGDVISVTGNNRGLYNYQVIELRSVAREELASQAARFDEGLIVLWPTNFWQTEVMMVVGR